MKNILVGFVLFFFGALCVQAQDISDHALGLRFGNNDGLGAEVSYQKALSNNNRLEADLGWRNGKNFSIVKITGLYQWVWELGSGFDWYLGAGGGLGLVNVDDDVVGGGSSSSFAFVSGDVGIEYAFEFPFQVALDFRPEIGFGKNTNGLGFDIGLAVRYLF